AIHSMCKLLLRSQRLFSRARPLTQIYTLSLHDALPISSTRAVSTARWSSSVQPTCSARGAVAFKAPLSDPRRLPRDLAALSVVRSEEHTSELQSRENLVCRLLLEKKKITSGTERMPLQP